MKITLKTNKNLFKESEKPKINVISGETPAALSSKAARSAPVTTNKLDLIQRAMIKQDKSSEGFAGWIRAVWEARMPSIVDVESGSTDFNLGSDPDIKLEIDPSGDIAEIHDKKSGQTLRIIHNEGGDVFFQAGEYKRRDLLNPDTARKLEQAVLRDRSLKAKIKEIMADAPPVSATGPTSPIDTGRSGLPVDTSQDPMKRLAQFKQDQRALGTDFANWADSYTEARLSMASDLDEIDRLRATAGPKDYAIARKWLSPFLNMKTNFKIFLERIRIAYRPIAAAFKVMLSDLKRWATTFTPAEIAKIQKQAAKVDKLSSQFGLVDPFRAGLTSDDIAEKISDLDKEIKNTDRQLEKLTMDSVENPGTRVAKTESVEEKVKELTRLRMEQGQARQIYLNADEILDEVPSLVAAAREGKPLRLGDRSVRLARRTIKATKILARKIPYGEVIFGGIAVAAAMSGMAMAKSRGRTDDEAKVYATAEALDIPVPWLAGTNIDKDSIKSGGYAMDDPRVKALPPEYQKIAIRTTTEAELMMVIFDYELDEKYNPGMAGDVLRERSTKYLIDQGFARGAEILKDRQAAIEKADQLAKEMEKKRRGFERGTEPIRRGVYESKNYRKKLKIIISS